MCLDMYAIGHDEERGLPCMLETCTPYKPCIRFRGRDSAAVPMFARESGKRWNKGSRLLWIHGMAVNQASHLADGPVEPMGVLYLSSPGVALA